MLPVREYAADLCHDEAKRLADVFSRRRHPRSHAEREEHVGELLAVIGPRDLEAGVTLLA
jgi:hypothetical protein